MVPKHKIQNIITHVVPHILELLDMKKYTLKFHIAHSNSEFLKSLGVNNYAGDLGRCYPSSNAAEIVIYYDQQKNFDEALATVIHEILHARFYPLASLVTMRENKALQQEEKLILDLEKLIMALI